MDADTLAFPADRVWWASDHDFDAPASPADRAALARAGWAPEDGSPDHYLEELVVLTRALWSLLPDAPRLTLEPARRRDTVTLSTEAGESELRWRDSDWPAEEARLALEPLLPDGWGLYWIARTIVEHGREVRDDGVVALTRAEARARGRRVKRRWEP